MGKNYIYYRFPEEKEICRKKILGKKEISWNNFDLEKHKGFVVSPFNTNEYILLFDTGESELVPSSVVKEKIFSDYYNLRAYKEFEGMEVILGIAYLTYTEIKKYAQSLKFKNKKER